MINQVKRSYPRTPSLLLDSGNFTDNPTEVGRVKTRALLEGMERLGYAVCNVGERDIRNGYDAFAELVGERKFEFVSANIVRADTKKPIFKPSLVLDALSPDGTQKARIGVIGVVRFNPLFRGAGPDGSQLTILHPKQAIEAELAALQKKQVDYVVLLAALHRDDARRLVANIPGIDFVIGSYGGVFTTNPDQEGDTWLLYSGNQGKRFGETRVFAGDGAPTHQSWLHLLSAIYKDDPEMARFVASIPIEEPEPQAAPAAHAAPPRSQARPGPFVGTETCRGCHVEETARWEETTHSHALETLEKAGKADQQACLSCHTTASGRPSGFRSRAETPALAAVGCESCHGPGVRHVQSPRTNYGDVTLAKCTPCHDAENSPDFDFYSYVKRVDHRRSGPR